MVPLVSQNEKCVHHTSGGRCVHFLAIKIMILISYTRLSASAPPAPFRFALTRFGSRLMRVAAVEQLFVREKYEVYTALRRDSALKASRELKRKQRERVHQQQEKPTLGRYRSRLDSAQGLSPLQ